MIEKLIVCDRDLWYVATRAVDGVPHLCICAPDGVIVHSMLFHDDDDFLRPTGANIWLRAYRSTTRGKANDFGYAAREMGRAFGNQPLWWKLIPVLIWIALALLAMTGVL